MRSPSIWNLFRSSPAFLALIFAFGAFAHAAAGPNTPASTLSSADAREMSAIKAPLLQLGPGDSIAIQVYGQPDMSGTVYVSDDGTIPVALAGPVQVAGLSPSQAASRIEKALRDGKFLVDPHVTLTVTQSRSQRVSVLGQVGKPGRYPIESNTTIFDLLAEAGGVTEKGGNTVYLLRQGKDGNVARYPISLQGLSGGEQTIPDQSLKGGDSIYVPHAPQFYVYGEVAKPGQYTVESGMTVIQAIADAGGITPRGSERRIIIKRRNTDGTYTTTKARLSELVQPEDVIRVKESIF